MFVKTVGPDGTMKRSAPAMGRKPIGPGAISLQRNTGRLNARGNPIWITATGKERSRRTSKSGAVYFTQPHATAASPRVYRPKFGPSLAHNTGRHNARGHSIWVTPTGKLRTRRTPGNTDVQRNDDNGKAYYAKPIMSDAWGKDLKSRRGVLRRQTHYSPTGFLNAGGRPVLAAPGGGYYVHNSAAKIGGIRRLAKKDAFVTHFMNM